MSNVTASGQNDAKNSLITKHARSIMVNALGLWFAGVLVCSVLVWGLGVMGILLSIPIALGITYHLIKLTLRAAVDVTQELN